MNLSNEYHEITQGLLAWNAGDEDAFNRLLPLIYDELHGLANAKIRQQPGAVTLQPTALVNEFYLRFLDSQAAINKPEWENRTHFFAVAATVMRRILVDQWRRKKAESRGGGLVDITLDEVMAQDMQAQVLDVLVLDQALTRLEKLDPVQARIVELRFFAGLTFVEVADVLTITDRSVKRKWTAARLWLLRDLKRGQDDARATP